MPFPHNVYKTQRIMPVRFRRGVTGEPDILFPDLDDRGYFRTDAVTGTDQRSHVVGVCEGDSIVVQMRREQIEDAVPLFVTSSNTGFMTVSDFISATDALALTHDVDVEITGVSGGAGVNPNVAELEIRFGSNTGPIIGILTVWVFGILNVNLTPHSVTIADGTGASIGTAVDIAAVMDMVKAIWRPCGVDFTVAPTVNDNHVFATAGIATWQAEINTVLSTNFAPGTINAYFLNQLEGGIAGLLGLGFSRANVVPLGLPNPGILLGDSNNTGDNRAGDTHWLANDLAHEIGHFFTLEHPDRLSPPSTPRFDTWTVRMLMHNFNTRGARTDWRNDVGYGATYRGSLITMKDLVDTGNAAHHSTDNECLTSRTVINTAPGPY